MVTWKKIKPQVANEVRHFKRHFLVTGLPLRVWGWGGREMWETGQGKWLEHSWVLEAPTCPFRTHVPQKISQSPLMTWLRQRTASTTPIDLGGQETKTSPSSARPAFTGCVLRADRVSGIWEYVDDNCGPCLEESSLYSSWSCINSPICPFQL